MAIGERVRVAGAGRTDAGVHATGQVPAFDVPEGTDLYRLRAALNGLTGTDISVVTLAEAPADFDPRRAARSRTYRYTIVTSRPPAPMLRDRSWHVYSNLDPTLLARLAAKVVGVHDFSAFRAADCESDSPEREVLVSIQRQDLNPIELGLAYQALARAGHTQEEIGRKVSMDRSSIANHIRLLELSRTIQADLEAGRLSMGHAKALLQVPDLEAREALRARILSDALTVRATEEAAREIARGENNTSSDKARSGARSGPTGPSIPKATLDPDTRAFIERLERRLQTRVELHPAAGGGGKLEIRYFDLEDLERHRERAPRERPGPSEQRSDAEAAGTASPALRRPSATIQSTEPAGQHRTQDRPVPRATRLS